jgi:hypothetical protein
MAFALQLRKTSARRPDEGAVQPVIPSNGVPFLQMRSVGSRSTPGLVCAKIKGEMVQSVNTYSDLISMSCLTCIISTTYSSESSKHGMNRSRNCV